MRKKSAFACGWARADRNDDLCQHKGHDAGGHGAKRPQRRGARRKTTTAQNGDGAGGVTAQWGHGAGGRRRRGATAPLARQGLSSLVSEVGGAYRIQIKSSRLGANRIQIKSSRLEALERAGEKSISASLRIATAECSIGTETCGMRQRGHAAERHTLWRDVARG